jgi:hypothetical protein
MQLQYHLVLVNSSPAQNANKWCDGRLQAAASVLLETARHESTKSSLQRVSALMETVGAAEEQQRSQWQDQEQLSNIGGTTLADDVDVEQQWNEVQGTFSLDATLEW